MPVPPGNSRLAAMLAVTVIAAAACGAPGAGSTRRNQDAASTGARKGAPLPVVAKNVESCARLPTRPPGTQGNGERLPQRKLPCLVSGPPVDLSQLGGRPVVINLWATWCRPCREEMPLLQDAQRRYGDRVQFLGVNTKDDPSSAAEFLQELGVTYPQVVDLDGDLLAFTRVPGLPVTLILQADGRIAGRQVGALTRSRLDALIGRAL